MRLIPLLLICASVPAAWGQDSHDWQSLAQLKTGDKVRLSLKTGATDGAFQSWTAQQVTAGKVTAPKDDVVKVERFGPGGMSRGKHAAIGALIGFGGGFAIGAASTGGCSSGNNWPFCISRGTGGAILGGVGAVIGAGVGALIPHHSKKDIIYSAR